MNDSITARIAAGVTAAYLRELARLARDAAGTR
jgi:hypothetical protein